MELARDFNFDLDFGEIKQYRTLPQKKIKTRPKAITYLEDRGIDREIIEKYQITTRKDNDNILVFPFYDDHGILRYVKYRNARFCGKGPKEWSEEKTMPILFGMNHCGDSGTIIFTEGQIDALSVACCGFGNVVSVPNGAKGFTWFVHCEQWLRRFHKAIIFGDNENGHITLVMELQNRLSMKIEVVRKQDYLGEKDANDILQKYGKDAIRYAINHAEPPKMHNIKDLSEVESVDIESLPKIRTGNTQLDRVLGGFYFGQLILLSGKRGDGKSTFASQIVAEALEQGYRVFVYSGELPDFHFKRWLDLQLAGPDNLLESQNELLEKSYRIKPKVQEKINQWYKGKAYIYDNSYVSEESQENETVLQTVENAIKLYDLKFVLIDNLMTAMDDEKNDDIYRAQSVFVGKLKRIAIKYNVVVLLVAHPRKNNKSGETSSDDVSGSGDITNKVDVVMFYARPKDSEGIGTIQVTKNRLTGRLATGNKTIQTVYSASSKRIVSIVDGMKCYGWEYEEDAPEGFQYTQEEIPF